MKRPLALRLTEAADDDLAEIWAYIAAKISATSANRFIAPIKREFKRLRRFPLSGPVREQLATGLRVAFHRAYAIHYIPQPDTLVIVRVLHGARDVATLVKRGGF